MWVGELSHKPGDVWSAQLATDRHMPHQVSKKRTFWEQAGEGPLNVRAQNHSVSIVR